MSKRRKNRSNGSKSAPEPGSKYRVNGSNSSVAATMDFSSPSRMAYSGEILPPAPLPEPHNAPPCGVTRKSVSIEPIAPMDSLMAELDTAPGREIDRVGSQKQSADGDSFPPLVSSDGEEPPDVYPPEVLARRKRARKLVGAFIGAAALFFAFGLGKTALASRGTTVSGALLQSKAEVARVHAAIGGSINGLVRSMADIARQAPVAKAVAAVQDASQAAATPDNDPAAGAKLRKEAESLLNRGRFKDAIDISRAAIEADPSHATSYLMLGTALQSTGKWKEGIEAYSECVRKASKGPVHECSAVGGRK